MFKSHVPQSMGSFVTRRKVIRQYSVLVDSSSSQSDTHLARGWLRITSSHAPSLMEPRCYNGMADTNHTLVRLIVSPSLGLFISHRAQVASWHRSCRPPFWCVHARIRRQVQQAVGQFAAGKAVMPTTAKCAKGWSSLSTCLTLVLFVRR